VTLAGPNDLVPTATPFCRPMRHSPQGALDRFRLMVLGRDGLRYSFDVER
jgi:hypothetical protein